MAEILNEWTHRQARSKLRRAGSQRKAAELAASIAGYEALRTAGGLSLEIGSIDDLGRALVKARIARGWTQAQLAQELGMPKQQVQRYEATAYASASLGRIAQVADTLGMSFTGTASSGLAPEGSSGLARLLAGFTAAEALQAVEKRIRLRRLSASEARKIYDDLCDTYYRLAPLHGTPLSDEQEGIAHRVMVRRAIEKLARKRGRLR
jgi:transcriptional regulator with XRE-family HTH domain